MKAYVLIDKEVGETPLVAIEKWKRMNAEYQEVSAAYAGRLDPMASGKLLVLLGEECKKQKKYTKLDKEYEIEVLFDVSSDTGDALGLVAYAGKSTPVDNFSRIDEILKAEEGSHMRNYPAYSSKTVHGKPLFMYALEGTMDTISIPTHAETVYGIKNKGLTSLSVKKLSERIAAFLNNAPTSNEPSKALGADFRIEAVRAAWQKLFAEANDNPFLILKLRVICGSGTYMRSLGPRIGNALGTKAIVLSIRRTKIGRWFRLLRYMYAY